MKYQARNNYLINWPEYPLLRITICFMIGIFLGDALSIPLLHSIVLLMGLVFTFLVVNRFGHSSRSSIRSSGIMILSIGILLGVVRGNLQQGVNNPFHYTHLIGKDNAVLVGQIISELKRKKRLSTTVKVQSVDGKTCSGKLLVYFGRGDSLISYQVGDIIALKGRIQRLKDNPNPKSFNYKDFLKYKGISCQMFLKDEAHKMLSSGRPVIFNRAALKIRKWALSVFESRLNEKDQFATASAMVLGYREHISDDLYASFSETGAVHILAVSGLHVGIICMIFLVFFNRIRNDSNGFKIIKLISLLSVVWIYALVTGASPAVLRAAVMFSLILVGRLWFKGANIYNILACSALLILMYDPFLLFQLSFQFSYLALISIVFFQPIIERLYETKNGISTKIWQLTTVSIAAQILVFPISVYHFHEFPTYFILSGVVAVFLATFILGIGIILLILNNVPELGDLISFAYGSLLEGFIWVIKSIQSLPYNQMDGIYFSWQSVLILYVLIGTAMYRLSIRPTNYKSILNKKISAKRISLQVGMICILTLTINAILHTSRIKNQKEFIVYNISGHTVIDVFVNGELYSIQSEKMDQAKVDFASKAYRIYNGNSRARNIQYDLGNDNKDELFMRNGSLVFKNMHLYFVDRVEDDGIIPCESDILFVVNKTDRLPYDFLDNHYTQLVVLDNSLSFKTKNQWIKECENRKIAVHDIRKDGVFRL